MPAWKDRRRAQSGATLIELLVSVSIIGLALVLVIGAFSTGLLDATVTKRNTAMEGAIQYELDAITSSTFNKSAQSYSECFATENTNAPVVAGYQQACPDDSFSMRADVSWTLVSPTVQLWTVAISTWPSETSIGSPVSIYKADR